MSDLGAAEELLRSKIGSEITLSPEELSELLCEAADKAASALDSGIEFGEAVTKGAARAMRWFAYENDEMLNNADAIAWAAWLNSHSDENA